MASRIGSRASNSRRPSARGLPPRVVVVTSDLGVYAAVAVLLGARVNTEMAATTAEALTRLGAAPLDVAILDVRQFGRSAAELSRFLKTRCPRCTVIAILASSHAEELAGWSDSPIDVFLTRPLNLEIVIRERAGPVSRERGWSSGLRPPGRYVSKAIDYFAQNYSTAGPIRRLAQAVGVSRGRLAHLFRRETGLTAREYLTSMRVVIAKRLLEATEDKLDTIAERVGFCDASHVSRVFTTYAGFRPGEYRRRCWGLTNGIGHNDRHLGHQPSAESHPVGNAG